MMKVIAALLLAPLALSSCVAMAVVDAAAGAAGAAVDVTGDVVGAAIPGGDDEDEEGDD